MNEQHLADLFSEQLDRMLDDQAVLLPDEAADLQGLLHLGKQFSQVDFKASGAAQAAFQGQMAGWFGPGMSAAAAGIPAAPLIVVLVVAFGGGLLFLGSVLLNSAPDAVDRPEQNAPAIIEEKTPAVETEPVDATAPEQSEAKPEAEPHQPPDQPGQNEKSSQSAGDTIQPKGTTSVGDTLLLAPETPSQLIPSATPTATVELNAPAGVDNEESNSSGDGSEPGKQSPSSPESGEPDSSSGRPEDDRGHGNDPGGYDPDNPGQSSGVPDNSSPNLSRGEEGGGGGASAGGGGNSGSGRSGGGDKDKGGKGKGKGKP